MICRRISELYYEREWSAVLRAAPQSYKSGMRMPCFSEIMRSTPDVADLRQIQLRCADAADFLERQSAGQLHWIFSFKHS